jgi:hypothetical protein
MTMDSFANLYNGIGTAMSQMFAGVSPGILALVLVIIAAYKLGLPVPASAGAVFASIVVLAYAGWLPLGIISLIEIGAAFAVGYLAITLWK